MEWAKRAKNVKLKIWSYRDETRTNKNARMSSYFWEGVQGGLVFMV